MFRPCPTAQRLGASGPLGGLAGRASAEMRVKRKCEEGRVYEYV